VKLSLNKSERLKSKKLIDALFASGHSSFVHPLKVYFSWQPQTVSSHSPILFSVSVPKKKIKIAAHRNKVKRRIREAYRQNKNPLHNMLTEDGRYQLALMFVHLSDTQTTYKKLEKAIVKLLRRLEDEIPD